MSGDRDLRDAWERLYSGQSRPWRGSADLSWVEFPPGSRVLDAGCGNGKCTETLLDTGAVVTGVDFSPSAVESCRSRFGSKAVFEVADLRDLPFEDGSFDVVLAQHSLEHISSESEHLALSEFRRVLKPGGLLYLQVFAEGDFRSGGEAESVRNGILYRYHSEDSLRASLTGWDVTSLCTEEERTRFGEIRRRIRVIARPDAHFN